MTSLDANWTLSETTISFRLSPCTYLVKCKDNYWEIYKFENNLLIKSLTIIRKKGSLYCWRCIRRWRFPAKTENKSLNKNPIRSFSRDKSLTSLAFRISIISNIDFSFDYLILKNNPKTTTHDTRQILLKKTYATYPEILLHLYIPVFVIKNERPLKRLKILKFLPTA